MKILSFGSLNVDYVYKLPHVVMKGETISSKALNTYRDKIDATNTFMKHIYEQVDEFADGVSQADDITMVCLSRK